MLFRAFALLFLILLPAAATAAPNVVVSVKPVASLVEGVMAGVGKPVVLVAGGQSLHTFSLKPSEARALNEAHVVFWVGESLETFLEKPLSALAGKAMVVALSDAPGVTVLKTREGGVWGHADHDHHDHRNVDGHIWLDPMNAKAIVAAAEAALRKADPANAAVYAANAKALHEKLEALDAELQRTLAPVSATPFVVFHDAYQYFEKRYNLNALGSLTVSPDRAPGAKRVAELKDKIKSANAVCAFAEPQFEPKLMATVVEGTRAKSETLDPEASALPTGPDLYFDLMRGMAERLTRCLSQ